jgi:putative copper export protein
VNTLLVIVHVLGACVWTGGHLLLAVGFLPAALRQREPQVILGFEARFERIGLPALVLQVVTGIMLAMRYLPDVEGGGPPLSGQVAMALGAKGILLVLTIALALHARLRLIPRLRPASLGLLAAHIVAVTIIAVLFVVVGVAMPAA